MAINVSGIVVQADPNNIDAVRAQLEAIPGVEIHGVSELGKMVVTLDKNDDRETTDTYEHISQLSGVLCTTMVYHHFEPEEAASATPAG